MILYSKQYNTCVYDMPDFAAAQQLINCMPVGSGCSYAVEKLFVPCRIDTMQVMAALGHEALSPILVDYSWPVQPGRTPLEHQKHMAAFMTLHPRCFNLSEMGAMKTLSVLWAWDYLMRVGQVKKVVIACTMSCMSDVWEQEINKNFLGRRTCAVIHGSRKKRVEQLRKNVDFYIINHDGLDIGSKHETEFTPGPLAEYFRANLEINGVTIDEGAEFRHQNTDMYKSLRYALRDKPYFNWLTGTPTPKDPTDAYAQAKMVRLDYHEQFTSFRERTMFKVDNFKWKAKREGYDIAASILKPAIRYDRNSAGIVLPPLVTLDRKAELSPAQTAAIKELKATLKTMVAGGKISALNEASLRMKLLQIAAGAVYGESHAVHKVDCAPRLKILREVIEQSAHKIIIFASLTSVVDMLHSELSKEYTVEKVTGNVSASARNDIFRDFRENENPRIIVAHPGTMSHGLNLTAASTTVWYGPTDDAGVFAQANARMDRPGQQNSMVIVRISSTNIEREIYRRLEEKNGLQGLMLDLIKGEDNDQ